MPRRPQHSSAGRGFTLLELIISVALVLVLMLAITKIFSITGSTIGASQGIAAATRDARAAQAVFAHDIGTMAPDSPFVFIRYDPPLPAFRNAADAAADADYVAGVQVGTNGLAKSTGTAAAGNQMLAKLTLDLDQNGVEGETTVFGENVGLPNDINPLAVNERSHRLDRFSFCSRDRFARQTGNAGSGPTDQIVSSLTGTEAWITYGHLALPRTDGQYVLADENGVTPATPFPTDPGRGTEQNNPQNFYASQWVLGRVAMLMVQPTLNSGAYIIQDNGSPKVNQQYYGHSTTAYDLSPLSNAAIGTVDGSTIFNANTKLQNARYDLVGLDLATASSVIRTYISSAGTAVPPWYGKMLDDRFRINPFVVKPISADTASQQVPAFLSACSQFIVEYAGDFVTQIDDGSLKTETSPGIPSPDGGLIPDGKIDFYVDPTTGLKKTQWYGYPRSTNGNNTVSAVKGDVLLLGDFVHYINSISTAPFPCANYLNIWAKNPNFGQFEHFLHPGDAKATELSNKQNLPLANVRNSAVAGGGLPFTVYAAWDPDTGSGSDTPRPKLYRITLTIDRQELAGRAAGGQTFEFVFNAP